MRGIAPVCLLIAFVLALAVGCAADGPPASIGDRLFGFTAPDGASADQALAEAYEKSGWTAASLKAEWGTIEPGEPGSGKYDFATFDNQPLAKSAKARICWISLANPRADAIKSSDPTRYWALAEAFVTALVGHANTLGIKHFAYQIQQDNPESSVGPRAANAEPLKRIYQAAKSVSKQNTVIAEQPYGSGANAIEILYRIGAKGSFDVAAISAVSTAFGDVDPFQLVAAHRELARNGDGDKKLLIIGSALGQTMESDYRNILTERDLYDPAWVIGELRRVSGKPTAEMLAAFPPKIPDSKLTAEIAADGPVFSYIPDKPYKLILTLSNTSLDNMKLDKWALRLVGAGADLKSDPDGALPVSVDHGQSATATFNIALPKEAAGKQVTIVATVDYTANDQKHIADCWLTLMATPSYEVTVLPPRLILDPREGTKRVGMSVINHTDAEFNGKITLSAYPGVTVNPAEFDTKIDPFGLEAFVYSISADAKAAPGHYAVFVDVGGQAREWQAVDVPIIVKSGPKGCLDAGYDRKDAASFAIGTTSTSTDGKSTFQRAGTGWMSYTQQALWLMVEMQDDGAKPGQLTIGFDVPVDGALASGPGYRDEDREFVVRSDDPILTRVRDGKPVGPDAPCRFDNTNGKGVYCVSIPWSELAPLKPAAGTSFAIGLAVTHGDGTIEWGGGIIGKKDPRKFVPVAMAE